jgi:hypothetical protein
MSNPHIAVADARSLAAKGEPVRMSRAMLTAIEGCGYALQWSRFSSDSFGVVTIEGFDADDTEVRARFARGEFSNG